MSIFEKAVNVLLAFTVVMGLMAGVLSLNRTAELGMAYGQSVGKAEADAGYARAKAEDAKADAALAVKEARLAEYYAVDLKIFLAEHGLHPPDDPWSKPKGVKK